ncbi:MAG: hypothetical protein ABI564_02255 [Ideonella sp.]
MRTVSRLTLALACVAFAQLAMAKMPPATEEAKAKAAEAAAKTAWGDKVASFQLCKVQDRLAASYRAGQSSSGKQPGTPFEAPPCTDPGPYAAAVPANAALEKAGAHSAPASTAPTAPAAAPPAGKS